MKQIKVIHINAETKTVTEKTVDAENLQDYYKLLDCRCITSGGYLPNGDCIYVDDEGLFANPEYFYELPNMQPLASHGVIVGTNNRTGNTISAKSTVEQIREQIKFVDIWDLRIRYAKTPTERQKLQTLAIIARQSEKATATV